MTTNTIHCTDALTGLRKLPDDSIDFVMTSPPYWALRDYDVEPIIWGGDSTCKHLFLVKENKNDKDKKGSGRAQSIHSNRYTAAYNVNREESALCAKCGAWRGSLGLEPSFDLYLDHLLVIFDEVKRVLKSTGTLWVNLSDTYAGSWGNLS